MTYSDAEKRVAAEQYSEAVKARWSETGNAIEAFPSVGVDLQMQVNRQKIEIEEAKRSNRCPSDNRPLVFIDPQQAYCSLCGFRASGFNDWTYEP